MGKDWLKGCIACLLVFATFLAVRAEDEGNLQFESDEAMQFEAADPSFWMNLQVRLQVRFTATDPETGKSSQSFDVARAQVRMFGQAFPDWKYAIQFDLADGSELSRGLLQDAFLVWDRKKIAQIWMGQGKVFFNRQHLVRTDHLQFVDRSIAADKFTHNPDELFGNRDTGLAVFGRNQRRTYNYAVGVYNGNGINKDEKDNTDYMVTGRLVLTPFGHVPLVETDLDRPRSSLLAVGISALTASRGTAALPERFRQMTGDIEIAYKYRGLNINAEFFTRSDNAPLNSPGDEEDLDGWYLQGGWLFKNFIEVALRYSEIIRDVPDRDETEAAAALNYYWRGHRHKIQGEARRLEFGGMQVSPGIDRWEFKVQLTAVF